MSNPEVIDTKFKVYTANGRALLEKAKLAFRNGRIEFLISPFSLKDEIKAMRGSKWHQHIEGDGRKIWSADDCFRNRFQLGFLQGQDVYAWFDRELLIHEFTRPLMDHQKDMTNSILTYHFGIWGAEMGTGKTLAAIEAMERSGITSWWFVAPKKVLEAIKREFKKWGLDPSITVELLTYEAMTRRMDEWKKDDPFPQGVIFDESSRLKTAESNRTRAAQFLADLMRSKYSYDCIVLLMSGTPSPKSPVDWWAQAEIAFPGFLREGSERSFKARLAFLEKRQFGAGGVHNDLVGWKDDEYKCLTCGQHKEEGPHTPPTGSILDDDFESDVPYHEYKQSVNEVALMYERLKGLVIIKHKKDCLDLPDKVYRKVYCKPLPSTIRVAQALTSSAINAVTGMMQLRELSDGFLYRETTDGMTACQTCNHGEGSTGEVKEWFNPSDEERGYSSIEMLNPDLVEQLEVRQVPCPKCDGEKEVPKIIRETREVPCPKEPALVELMGECEESGRIVIFAGFTGSVDRCVNICMKEDWTVVRCDGRGFQIMYRDSDGTTKVVRDKDALDYWADMSNERVAFVAHPESGGMGLTLTEAHMAVFYSNSYKPEYRSQSEDRIHRAGMDVNRGATIVDLIHLPTDERVLETLRKNRSLELMTMGEFTAGLKWDEEA